MDSRDIEERITYLEGLRDDFQEENNLPDWISQEDYKLEMGWTDEESEKWIEWDQSGDGMELDKLCAFRDEFEGYCDWQDGVTLIRDSYFEEYAEELVKDIGDLPNDLPWYIESNINWKGVAEDVRMDYTSGEFGGVTYWAR